MKITYEQDDRPLVSTFDPATGRPEAPAFINDEAAAVVVAPVIVAEPVVVPEVAPVVIPVKPEPVPEVVTDSVH